MTGYQVGYEDEIEKIGASFIMVPFERAGFNPFSDLRLLRKYYRIIKENKIDLVHSYTIKPNIYGSIAAYLCGIRNIFPTLNGIGYAFTGNGLKAFITRQIASLFYFITFRCSKKVFFHNRDDIELIVNHNLIKLDKCVLIAGSGIDLEYYRKQDIPDEISFLLISRLLKVKGVIEYIKAAEKIKLLYPDINFKLVGPADPNPTGIKISEIQSYLDKGIIEYFGRQDDIRPFLKEAAVFVLPSYREGLSHTILEAMAVGRAIITTNVPGCKETVLDGLNGYLVEPYSVDDLADKMKALVEDPQIVKEMGNKSFQMAADLFEVGKVNKNIMDVMGL